MMESVRNLHLVLFIGFMCVVQSMYPICPYSDQNCLCGSNSVTCDNLQQIPTLKTGPNVRQVSDLTFYRGNMTNISKNILPPGLTSITLQFLPLTNISEDAFDTSAATLTTIYFSFLNLNSLPLALKKLTKLTSLTIEYTKIQDWDTATLKQIATTLEHLRLINVGLSTWPSWIVYFQLLQEVDLSSNPLNSIPEDAFSSIKDSLTILDLSSTGLTHVPKALSSLSSLTNLYLDYNNFTDVSEIKKITGFPFAQKLSVLSLVSVGVSRIANFSSFTNLISMNLSGNSLSDIPAGFLPASLTSMHLKANSLSSVPKNLATLTSLYELLIYDNLITDIEPNSFPQRLTNLDLGHNKIHIITNTTFKNLNLLQILGLYFNPITTISPEAFSDLVSLQALDVQYSQLIEIPLAFSRLNSLVELFFSTYQLLTCPCPVYQDLVQWFTSLADHDKIDATCSNGQSIGSYLSGQCDLSLATL